MENIDILYNISVLKNRLASQKKERDRFNRLVYAYSNNMKAIKEEIKDLESQLEIEE